MGNPPRKMGEWKLLVYVMVQSAAVTSLFLIFNDQRALIPLGMIASFFLFMNGILYGCLALLDILNHNRAGKTSSWILTSVFYLVMAFLFSQTL